MTKDELKAKINNSIAKYGRNIDGVALSDILNGIVDAIPELPEEKSYIIDMLFVGGGFADKTKAEAAELLDITEDDLDNLFAGKYSSAREGFQLYPIFSINDGNIIGFISGNTSGEAGTVFYLSKYDGTYSFNEV